MKFLHLVCLSIIAGVALATISGWLFWQDRESSTATGGEVAKSFGQPEFHGTISLKNRESTPLSEDFISSLDQKIAAYSPKVPIPSAGAVDELSQSEFSATFASAPPDLRTGSAEALKKGVIHHSGDSRSTPRDFGYLSTGGIADRSIVTSWVETSINLSIPADAPLPAVVAASLEMAVDESSSYHSAERAASGVDRIFNDYVAEAERPAPQGERLQHALDAADQADERFRMLYGQDAYLKYTVEAARLSLQETQ